MAKANDKRNLPVTFVGLNDDEKAPFFAAYQVNSAGQPVKKIGRYDGKVLKIDLDKTDIVTFGPDVDDFKALPRESLVSYRVAQKIDLWRKQGIVLARDIWDHFHFHFACVTGTVKKCRPWFWDRLDDIRLRPMVELAQEARFKPITADLNPHIAFPVSCVPLCDGIVEIYERECCCHHIIIPDLLDRLRDILEVLPIPVPYPIPDPFPPVGPRPGPIPFPGPRPGPGPDPVPFEPRLLRAKARMIQKSKKALDLNALPPENLLTDYLALRELPVETAQEYVFARPYLYPLLCHCTTTKVGQTPIQPGGKFDFCYLRVHHHYLYHHHCTRTYAYVIKQLINGVMTTVYDGLAANEYFAAGEQADVRSFNPQALACADGPGDPPPSDGLLPFVMLEHIGRYGTFHHNFPVQTDVSRVGALGLDDGTYTTSYAPDCPWGGGLGLRLWFSPELEPIVKYYRLKVSAVNNSGVATGTPVVLNNTVTWDKLFDIPGDIIRVPETLGPVSVGAENDLFKVPYWSSPDHRYLSGQVHQSWNTAHNLFPDGKYMLILEVFDGAGNLIKPNGATGPGTAKNFQFRRWASLVDTDPVPFADAAHVFWVDNTPVGGDIVDLRQNGIPNTAECQFMSGPGSDTLAIGFRAFHVNGVEHAGNGDDNSFMWHYRIRWQRGLNGDSGLLGPAPSGGTNHTDVGETGGPVTSGSETFANMLDAQPKCTFSVTLRVYAKHFTGRHRIRAYDYYEIASFALETT